MTLYFFAANSAGYQHGDLVRNPDDPDDEERYLITGSMRYDNEACVGPSYLYEIEAEAAPADPAREERPIGRRRRSPSPGSLVRVRRRLYRVTRTSATRHGQQMLHGVPADATEQALWPIIVRLRRRYRPLRRAFKQLNR